MILDVRKEGDGMLSFLLLEDGDKLWVDRRRAEEKRINQYLMRLMTIRDKLEMRGYAENRLLMVSNETQYLYETKQLRTVPASFPDCDSMDGKRIVKPRIVTRKSNKIRYRPLDTKSTKKKVSQIDRLKTKQEINGLVDFSVAKIAEVIKNLRRMRLPRIHWQNLQEMLAPAIQEIGNFKLPPAEGLSDN